MSPFAKSAALLLLPALLLGCNKGDPGPFVPPGGGFSVNMPGVPNEETQKLNAAAGTFVIHSFGGDLGGIGYFVHYYDFPSSVADADAALDAEVEFKKALGTVISQDKIRVEGRPGRDVQFRTDEGAVMVTRARFILDGKRMFQLNVITTPAQTDSPKVRAFLDSFHLTARDGQ